MTTLEATVEPAYTADRCRGWAEGMCHATWRELNTWSQTQGRNIDRIAGGVRPALISFSMSEVPFEHVRFRIEALRKQLVLIEAQCQALDNARADGQQTSPARAPSP